LVLLQILNEKKEMPADCMDNILANLSTYMEAVHEDKGPCFIQATLFPLFETFLRKLFLCFNVIEDVNPLLRLIICILKVPHLKLSVSSASI